MFWTFESSVGSFGLTESITLDWMSLCLSLRADLMLFSNSHSERRECWSSSHGKWNIDYGGGFVAVMNGEEAQCDVCLSLSLSLSLHFHCRTLLVRWKTRLEFLTPHNRSADWCSWCVCVFRSEMIMGPYTQEAFLHALCIIFLIDNLCKWMSFSSNCDLYDCCWETTTCF